MHVLLSLNEVEMLHCIFYTIFVAESVLFPKQLPPNYNFEIFKTVWRIKETNSKRGEDLLLFLLSTVGLEYSDFIWL